MIELGATQYLLKHSLPALLLTLAECQLEIEGTGDGEVTITQEVVTDLETCLEKCQSQLQAFYVTTHRPTIKNLNLTKEESEKMMTMGSIKYVSPEVDPAIPHDIWIKEQIVFRKGIKLSVFIKAAERWFRLAEQVIATKEIEE